MIDTSSIRKGNRLMFDTNEKRYPPKYLIPGIVVSWTRNEITFENDVVKPATHVCGAQLSERIIEDMGFQQTTVKYANGNTSVGKLWHKDGYLIRNFGPRFRVKKVGEPHILIIEYIHELQNILSGELPLVPEKLDFHPE